MLHHVSGVADAPWLSRFLTGSTTPPYVYQVMPWAPCAIAANVMAKSSSLVGKRFQDDQPLKYWMIGQMACGRSSFASATSSLKRSMSRIVTATHLSDGSGVTLCTG